MHCLTLSETKLFHYNINLDFCLSILIQTIVLPNIVKLENHTEHHNTEKTKY